MTQQPSPTVPPAVPPRSGLDGMFDWFRGLGVGRDTDNRWFGGVCSGLARRFGVDPILVRALTVLLALFGGVGLTLYILAWLFLPDPQGRILAEAAIRDGDGWGIVLIVVFGLLVVTGISVGHNGPGWFAWWLVPLAVIGFIVIRSTDRKSVNPPPPGGTTVPPTPYAAPPAPAQFGTTPADGTPPTAQPVAPTPAPGGAWAAQPAAYATSPGATASAQRYPAQPPAWTPRPPVAPPPPRPRRRPAGGSAALVALGLVIAGYGLGYLLDGPTGFPGSPELLGTAVALGAVSLLALGLGISGRRAGFAGVLTIVLGFATWVATISPLPLPTSAGIGDRTWVPAVSSGQVSYQVGVGDATLDLRDIAGPSLGGSGSPEITVNVGLGGLRIIVPADVTARVHYETGLGSVHVVNPAGDSTNLATGSANFTGTTTVGSGERHVDVTAHVGLGDITIEQR